MDPLTHLLITRVACGRDHASFIAAVAPDLPFYATYPAWVLWSPARRTRALQNDWPPAPAWMTLPHHIAHSLPVLLVVALGTRWCHATPYGTWPRWLLAWLLHILVDIPTHARRHWAPQFLWPCSTYTVDGVSWPVALMGWVRQWRGR